MARTLKGGRYLDAHNAGLAGVVMDVLPYCDFQQALDIYETILGAADVRAKDLAFIGCNDRFFMLTVMLHRKDAHHPWLYDRCREVEDNPDGHLDLWSREHYKSTIITFAGAIQEIMVNPEITIGLFSHTKDAAQVFLGQIMQEFELNELLIECYSDVIWKNPRSEAKVWAVNKGLVLIRKSNPKEATIEAHGLLSGMPTGRHFQLMIYDDLITELHVSNADIVRKVTEAWELSDNLGAGDVRKWHIGTRYHFGDTYGLILEREALIPRIYPATHDGTMYGRLVFMGRKRWEEKVKTQRATLAAQMLQNPTAGRETTFQPSWFQRYDVRPAIVNVYIMVDPSGGESKGSDRTAFAVVAVDTAGNKYLVDGLRHRMPLSDRWRHLVRLRKKWLSTPGVRNVFVGYEKYGMQADIEYFNEKMRQSDDHFEIKELNWPRSGGHSKRDRVGRLEPDVRNGRFRLPNIIFVPSLGDCYWHIDVEKSKKVTIPVKGPTKMQRTMTAAGQGHRNARAIRALDQEEKSYDVTSALIEEMLFFPFAPHDDLVDAVSRIYDMDVVTPDMSDDQLQEINAVDWEDA